MPEYTRDEALAFIEAMRLTLDGKTGFKWLVEKMSSLSAYVEAVSAENDQLNAYVDATGCREGFEAFRAERSREATPRLDA